MCILCVIQKWSRQVATMLPWLVIPLIGLWALSQLLPPAFRFEITSPRLACVFVLLFTLFWYEILMPQLSTWRVRRNERLKERKRFEAIELQKLKKTATRRCRNCLTPYKDQNPGGGKFMCSYCGHISKRPVLDLPVPPGFSNSALIKDLVGKSGKILNRKVRSDNGWMHCEDWLENGNWGSPSVVGKSTYRRKNGSSVFGDNHCLAEKSYSGIVIFACKILTSFFLSIRWLWRKTFGIGSTREDISSDADHRKMLEKRSENVGNFQESRSEKARRKAEEKRQARIEKELLEEEERKQREEVARLVEERRRTRDEKLEAEKDRDKALLQVKARDSKKEAEKRRQERRKEKDRGSSKSNSDVEELDKRSSKESEKKRDSEKKSEIDRRESYRYLTETGKGQSMDAGHGIRNISANNFSRVNAGNRYLDHMKGTLLSSSKAFSGSGFLGRSSNTATATGNKDNKPNSSVDHVHPYGNRRDMYPIEHVPVKHSLIGDDKNIDNPVIARQQTSTAPKKTWQQLFTGSSSSPQSTNTNVISRPVPKNQQEACIPKFSGQSSSMHLFDNPISFGLPSPFNISTFPDGSPTTSSGFSAAIEPFPRVGGEFCELIPEEPELFEDTCHIPDPVSLLGPVSESLDNFQLDQGTGFISEIGLERPSVLKFASVSSEINKPSPIESPLSREKHSCSNRFPSTPKAHHQDKQTGVVEGVNANEQGTWQMWNSSPLGQDGLGLVGGPVSWLLSPDCNRPNKDDFMQSPPQKTMASLFAKDDQVPSGAHPHRNVSIGNGNSNGNGTFSPVIGSGDHDPWSENAFFSQLSGSENHFVLKTPDGSNQTGMHYGSPSGPCTNHPFELSPANCWSKNEWPPEGAGDSGAKLSFMKPPPVGDQFPIPSSDVESLWSV